jgi:hypothetical protein
VLVCVNFLLDFDSDMMDCTVGVWSLRRTGLSCAEMCCAFLGFFLLLMRLRFGLEIEICLGFDHLIWFGVFLSFFLSVLETGWTSAVCMYNISFSF